MIGATALMLGTAQAGIIWREFRIGHEVNFDNMDDPANGLYNGDDYFTENGVYKARYALVWLYDETTSSWVTGVTDDDGLVTFSMNTDHMYHLTLFAWHDHEASGRVVRVTDGINGSVLSADSASFDPDILSQATNPFPFLAAIPGNEWINVAAIASWVVRRRPSAYPTAADNGANYDLAMVDPATVTPTFQAGVYHYYDASSQAVLIDPDDREGYAQKFLIAHEFAHELQHWANYNGSGSVQAQQGYVHYALDDFSECTPFPGPNHQMASKEWQSAAILEGMAHFVAAVAFNNTTQADCRLVPYAPITWDWGFGTSHDGPFSCQGYTADPTDPENDAGGVEYAFYEVDGLDYLGDTHALVPPGYSCLDVGTVTGVATELDWLRFFWDVNTTEGVLYQKLFAIYDDAAPEGWNTNSPVSALQTQFTNHGVGTAWTNQATRNGVNR